MMPQPVTLERLLRGDLVVVEFLSATVKAACPLNSVALRFDPEERNWPTHFVLKIHVPIGPDDTGDKTYVDAIEVVEDHLGDVARCFEEPGASVEPTFVSEGDTLYARHDVYLKMIEFGDEANPASPMVALEEVPRS